MARAKIKPPKNKNTLGCAYGDATFVKISLAGVFESMNSSSYSPINGNNTKGTRAVTGSGIASVAHQHAINNTTPATCQASLDKPPGGEVSSVKRKRINPETKPINFGLEILLIKKGGAKLIAPQTKNKI